MSEEPRRLRGIEVLGYAAFAVVASAGVWQLLVAADRVEVAFGCLGLLIGGGGVSWPVLRGLEKDGLSFGQIRTRTGRRSGVIVRCSRAFLVITATMFLGLGVICVAMNSAAPGEVAKVELWGAAGLTFFGLVALVLSTIRMKPGILLSTEGIVWHERFHPAAFIPWEALARAVTFNNVVHYTSTPCFGLLVSDGEAVDVGRGRGRRESLYYQLAQTGCHFVYVSENLLYSSEKLAALVNYYIEHPERRGELSSGVMLRRVEEILKSGGANADVALARVK